MSHSIAKALYVVLLLLSLSFKSALSEEVFSRRYKISSDTISYLGCADNQNIIARTKDNKMVLITPKGVVEYENVTSCKASKDRIYYTSTKNEVFVKLLNTDASEMVFHSDSEILVGDVSPDQRLWTTMSNKTNTITIWKNKERVSELSKGGEVFTDHKFLDNEHLAILSHGKLLMMNVKDEKFTLAVDLRRGSILWTLYGEKESMFVTSPWASFFFLGNANSIGDKINIPEMRDAIDTVFRVESKIVLGGFGGTISTYDILTKTKTTSLVHKASAFYIGSLKGCFISICRKGALNVWDKTFLAPLITAELKDHGVLSAAACGEDGLCAIGDDKGNVFVIFVGKDGTIEGDVLK